MENISERTHDGAPIAAWNPTQPEVELVPEVTFAGASRRGVMGMMLLVGMLMVVFVLSPLAHGVKHTGAVAMRAVPPLKAWEQTNTGMRVFDWLEDRQYDARFGCGASQLN